MMLVEMGRADILVGGRVYSTKDILSPAFQIIKTQPGVSVASGAFIMHNDDHRFVFADCAVNIAPIENDLVDIANSAIQTAKYFDIDPNVAILSFSSNGSGTHPKSTLMQNVADRVKSMNPSAYIEGEIQFDAAFSPSIRESKFPNANLRKEPANVYIFPGLNSGNITYKAVQQLGGYNVIGPIVQGMNKPISDLSRGASSKEVANTIYLTAIQSSCKI